MTDPGEQAAGWYAATQVASPERPELTFELDVDVCIVGAGLAGLTTAREVARRGWSVAVLEGLRVGWAASGRNAGFALPGFSESAEQMIERIGLDHAKQLWALSEAGLDYVRQTITDTGMPGVDPVPGWLNVSKTGDANDISATVERLRWFGADVEAWPTERVRSVLPSPRYFNAMHVRNAFHLHPLNYALGLARAAEAAGARIFEHTPAISIDPAGVRKRIVTPSARVRASQVVLAGNVHLGSLMPRLAATLIPISSYVMVTEPLGPVLHEVVRYRGAVSDGQRADNHYRIVGDDRLQWSGRMTTWQADPRWFARGLIADIRRIFPQLGAIKIAHLWSGTLGRPVHKMPQIGELMPGVWVASGFGGHGINTTAMAGELIARGIVETDQTWRMFAPYELVWAGGRIGRWVAQSIYWGSRPVEKIEQGFARYRERARARKRAKQADRQTPQAQLDHPGPPAQAPAMNEPPPAASGPAGGEKAHPQAPQQAQGAFPGQAAGTRPKRPVSGPVNGRKGGNNRFRRC